MSRLRRLVPLIGIFVVLISCLAIPLPIKAATTLVINSSAYDGTVFSYSDNYDWLQLPNSENRTVEYTDLTTIVGQNDDGGPGGTNIIWRTVYFFDTSILGSRATISAVTLEFYGETDVSGTDFDFSLYTAGDVHQPLVYTDYDAVKLGTGPLGGMTNVLSTAAFVTNAYNTLTFTAGGLSYINKTGVSAFVLRSSRDVSETVGALGEHVNIWSSESAHPPRLTVTYTTSILGNPDTMNIAQVMIFSNYKETGDQLYCFASYIKYATTPSDETPEEYFSAQLIDGGVVMAQTPAKKWGYGPLSIYLNAATALTWGQAYTIRLTGTNLFAVPPTFDYTLVSSNWKGSNLTTMDLWIVGVAMQMGIHDGLTSTGYLTSLSGKTVINDAGTEMFTDGVPYINAKRPEMFTLASDEEQIDTTVGNAHSTAIYNTIPAYFRTRFDTIMPGTIPGYWIPSIAFAGLAVAVIVLIRQKMPGSSTLSYMAAIPVMGIGFMFGVPVWIAMVVCTVAILMLGYALFLQRT